MRDRYRSWYILTILLFFFNRSQDKIAFSVNQKATSRTSSQLNECRRKIGKERGRQCQQLSDRGTEKGKWENALCGLVPLLYHCKSWVVYSFQRMDLNEAWSYEYCMYVRMSMHEWSDTGRWECVDRYIHTLLTFWLSWLQRDVLLSYYSRGLELLEEGCRHQVV